MQIKAKAIRNTRRRQKLPVGNKIRELRKSNGLTQAELAGKIGIQQSDLCRMEKGEYKVALETLFKILHIFQMTIGDFFADQDSSVGQGTAELVRVYRRLPSEHRKEVLEFARFKETQSD